MICGEEFSRRVSGGAVEGAIQLRRRLWGSRGGGARECGVAETFSRSDSEVGRRWRRAGGVEGMWSMPFL